MSHLPDTPDSPESLPTPADHETASAAVPVAAVTAPDPAAEPAAPAVADLTEQAEDTPSVPVEAAAAAAEPAVPTAAPTAEASAAEPVHTAPNQPRAPDLSPAACAELLKQNFPALFAGPPKPLKLRIQQDIQQRAPGVFSKGSLGAFFRRYTGSTGYLIALGKASQRFDLDGQPAGELSEEHRNLAREELTRRRQLGRERDQAAQAQQQAALAQQQAAQAELLQARQARWALLRDFERTTLTLANFCALKGLTPDTLTPLLEQAKREAAEAPPPRPFDDRRGPPGPRRDERNSPRPEGRRDARPPRDDQANSRQNGPGPARGDDRSDHRPDHRPQGPRPAGRPGRPGGPAGRPGGR